MEPPFHRGITGLHAASIQTPFKSGLHTTPMQLLFMRELYTNSILEGAIGNPHFRGNACIPHASLMSGGCVCKPCAAPQNPHFKGCSMQPPNSPISWENDFYVQIWAFLSIHRNNYFEIEPHKTALNWMVVVKHSFSA